MVLVFDIENGFLDVCTPGKIASRARQRERLRLQLESIGARKTTGSRLRGANLPDVPPPALVGVSVTPAHMLYTDREGVVRPIPGPGATSIAPALAGTSETLPAHQNREWWEAKVKAIKGQAVVKLADTLGLKFERIAPNPGVLCMRARNAIYYWLKQGNLPDASVLSGTVEK